MTSFARYAIESACRMAGIRVVPRIFRPYYIYIECSRDFFVPVFATGNVHMLPDGSRTFEETKKKESIKR